MTHTINRLQFEFTCHNEDQAFNLRHNFAITLQDKIAEITDSICSKYLKEDEWLKIDKLKIDLGRFSSISFEAEFPTIFKDKFERELLQNFSGLSSQQKKALYKLSRFEIFQYFLQTGNLPWFADETEIDINELSLDLFNNQTSTIKEFFYSHRFKKNVWLRAAFQLNKEARKLIFPLVEELKLTKDLFTEWILKLTDLFENEKAGTLSITDLSIDEIILKNAPDIFQNFQQDDALLHVFQNVVNEFFPEKETIIKKMIKENEQVFLKANFKEEVSKKESADHQSSVDEYLHLNKPAVLSDDLFYAERQEEILTNKHLVKHVGIILLNPFLKLFFKNLNLLETNEWKTKDAQYKAVHLLKFLSTGLQQTPEYNLTLEKIICGLNIEEPIPLEIIINENEISESESLLESVIEHWKAVKNTSVSGLREAFLKRDGILTKKENGWLLQVERKTLDILIESIPWGYSTIAFSWNDNLIHVEW